ncbi:FCD domain-containing protein [Devosia algicola]|uniref:FCD domain-containing protein n=1 Tax=Devosia algicola TaxID=3026418 RepID=A0ABY7YLS3_9HYPH|nr:FCD domain-containing protein [Devosia algicola]WDR02167.1 FCD domain-containing protein [Devosia algicola]
MDPEVVKWRLAVDQDVSFILSLCDVRMIIEPAAAARAAKFAVPEQLVRMSDALERMAIAKSANSYTSADMEFHATILEAAGNELLLQLGSALDAALIASRRVTLAIDNSAVDTIDIHRKILEAISDKQPDVARESMEKLISITSSHVMAALSRKAVVEEQQYSAV